MDFGFNNILVFTVTGLPYSPAIKGKCRRALDGIASISEQKQDGCNRQLSLITSGYKMYKLVYLLSACFSST